MANTKALSDGDKLIPACEIYVVYKNKEVLVFKRSPSYKVFPGYFIAPGGHINEDEDPMTAVIRECKEESGITLSPEQVKLKAVSFHHHLDRKEVWCEYLFRADVDEKQEIKSNTEGEACWVDIDTLLTAENVFPPSKHYFKHILSNSSGIKFSSSSWKDLELVEEVTDLYQNVS